VPTKTHERILDAATRLLYQDGLHVSMDRIIAEAQVAPMTVYRQFSGKDELVAATLQRWSGQWLGWLHDRIDRRGDDPGQRMAGLWEALEEWFATEGFRGSLIANAAAELRGEPAHPAQKVIAAHRAAMRQFLVDLAVLTGAHDPAGLAAELEVLVEGAVVVAMVDRRPAVGVSVRALAATATAAAGSA
jgi:AcrR family transcriptional regulator